jgi:asparagine synthase (glutamine-hydrolysing)
MCGICGFMAKPSCSVDQGLLTRMTRRLGHRGPDDEGYYVDPSIGLGMRRLSIIDLLTGHQPMTNEDRTLWLVFNGEIYNFRELRTRLSSRGHHFSSQSDAEVVIHAYEEYGDQCVDHFNGMFAFALWDAPRRRLLLARDRLGIKPLYYWASKDQLVFGSELKAVMTCADVPRQIDPIALDQFLTLEYIPSPRTIYQGVNKLPPGHRLIFQDGRARLEPYWDISFGNGPIREECCRETLWGLLQDAVRLQMVSDVPLGAFLSGGIDSSTVVALMHEVTQDSLQTFSIGFGDVTYNELPYARTVATRFGTQHHEKILEPDLADLAERLVRHLDEPLGDFSILPTYLVSELARESVKVVLTGDGGDELFGGYDTYVAQQWDGRYRRLPAMLRTWALPALMRRVPPQPAKKGLINKAKRFVEGSALPPSLQHVRWMIFLNDADKEMLYTPSLQEALDGHSTTSLFESYLQRVAHADPLAQQQYVDVKTYLADNILTKVDRMSMATSLEVRVPLLDHRIVEYALNLPPHLKLRRGRTKQILRQTMESRLPGSVLKKPKQGFSMPMKHWLRSSLRPLMLDLLSEETLHCQGYFDPSTVTCWMREHLDGRADHSHRLWALIVFELWHQQMQREES